VKPAGGNWLSVPRLKRGAYLCVAIVWVPALWVFLKYGLGVSDRYFPDPLAVVEAARRLGITLVFHSIFSVSRLIVGYAVGCLFGIFIGIYLFKYKPVKEVFSPGVHAIRAVPATAIVPFFILWFGFAELGKVLIIITGISLNLAISVLQILQNTPDKYRIAFHGYNMSSRTLPLRILLPFALEPLLPTMRFSLTVAVSLSVVAEYLGAQSGLAYLIQSARTTYSFEVLVLAATIFGLITWVMDRGIQALWRALVPWTTGLSHE
jgi:sulfonate transport system permease protein